MGLYALACHALGDWLLQMDWMAAHKFEDRWVRAAHCAVYTAAFGPFLIAWAPPTLGAVAFLTATFGTHYAIDSRRWYDAREGFETRPLWFDQVLHVVALAVTVGILEVIL